MTELWSDLFSVKLKIDTLYDDVTPPVKQEEPMSNIQEATKLNRMIDSLKLKDGSSSLEKSEKKRLLQVGT